LGSGQKLQTYKRLSGQPRNYFLERMWLAGGIIFFSYLRAKLPDTKKQTLARRREDYSRDILSAVGLLLFLLTADIRISQDQTNLFLTGS